MITGAKVRAPKRSNLESGTFRRQRLASDLIETRGLTRETGPAHSETILGEVQDFGRASVRVAGEGENKGVGNHAIGTRSREGRFGSRGAGKAISWRTDGVAD